MTDTNNETVDSNESDDYVSEGYEELLEDWYHQNEIDNYYYSD